MPHDRLPKTGASPEAVKQGYEPLGAETSALGKTVLIFFISAGLMLWGLFALLDHYLAENISEDSPISAAPPLPAAIASPLEPMPGHNDLDWQDLVHLRQRENGEFHAMGWKIDRQTGQAIIPAPVASVVIEKYSGGAPLAEAQPLRFPPTMAPVRAGPQESLTWANIFPPVGGAAQAEQVKQSIYVPAPGPRDIEKYPPAQGPAGQQNNPTTAPAP